MPLLSVPAVYDGKEIRLLEAPPVHGRYRVLVTFVEPARPDDASPVDHARFRDALGAWEDDRPLDATLADIYKGRRSRTEPPIL